MGYGGLVAAGEMIPLLSILAARARRSRHVPATLKRIWQLGFCPLTSKPTEAGPEWRSRMFEVSSTPVS